MVMPTMRYTGMIAAAVTILAGCGQGPESGYGFTLPEGDVGAGEAAFKRFQCGDCHAIANRQDLREGIDPLMTVTLGGETTWIQTYGQLVTAVINPSHEISERYPREPVEVDGASAMRNYNDVMTVSEMADIVLFLQEQYELEPYVPTHYRGYPLK